MAGVAQVSRPIMVPGSRRSFLRKTFGSSEFWRGILAIVVFLCLWEIGARSKQLFGYALPYFGLLPAPSEVAVAWSKVLTKAGYWESWYQSFKRVLLGFAAAQLVGIPFGLMLAVNRYFREIFFPPFEVLRPIPPLAWIPLSILWFGIGDMQIQYIIFLAAFFPVVLNSMAGARDTDSYLVRAGLSLGARAHDLFFTVVLPGALPNIFTGLRIGLGIGWMALVAGELVAAPSGLGYLINNARTVFRSDYILLGMVLIGALGLVLDYLMRQFERFVMPWHRGQ